MDEQTFSEIREAFHRHHMIFFRDQQLTPQQHNDFAGRFAEVMPHPYVQSIDGFPGIIEIVKEPDEPHHWGGQSFHADLTFMEAPPAGAALYAREVPEYGADTMFVNMHLAYETLSPGMQALLGRLEAVHESLPPDEYSASYKGMRPKPNRAGTFVHPMVIAHPDTGRKSLYLNPNLTRRLEGMRDEESRPLLDYLIGRSLRPEFMCRFRWRPGSMAVWDNRVTLHCAIEDDFEARRGGNGHRRVMHRATLKGDKPRRTLS